MGTLAGQGCVLQTRQRGSTPRDSTDDALVVKWTSRRVPNAEVQVRFLAGALQRKGVRNWYRTGLLNRGPQGCEGSTPSPSARQPRGVTAACLSYKQAAGVRLPPGL